MKLVSNNPEPDPRSHYLFEDAPGPWLQQQDTERLREWIEYYERGRKENTAIRETGLGHLRLVGKDEKVEESR